MNTIENKNDITVFYEATPNPHSMKFNVTTVITNETAFFDDPMKTSRSPLAQKIFGFPWAKAVLIGPSSITITKQEWVDWQVLADPLADLLKEHLESQEGVIYAVTDEELSTEQNSIESIKILDSDSDEVKKIKDILNREIRPAVAMDGGDITFARYEDGRLFLNLKGSCSGCPSSLITLKDGVEARLKEVIPSLIEVVST